MAYQDAQNISVRYKVQSAKGSPASGSAGKELPLVASPGLKLNKAAISDPAISADGMTGITRHGSRSVTGGLTSVVRLGALDEPIEALCRGTWVASADITQATMTSITTTTNTIVAAGGSWITQGVRVGQVVTLAGHATTANNAKRLPVVGVSATTITVPAGYLTADASPDSSFTLTVHKYIGQGTTKRYFTFDRYLADNDISYTSTDCVWTSMQMTMQPDAAVTVNFGVVGINQASNATGSSPVLTSPTQYTTANMVATDALILKNGVVVSDVTGFDFTLSMGGSTLPVIGSTTSPDVFVENTTASGSIQVPILDATWFDHFANEDELSLFLMLVEPEAEPKDFLAVFLPLVKLTAAPDDANGGTGALVGSMALEIGRKPTTSGYLTTMAQFATSAA